MITDQKPLVAIISKDIATLSQQLQCIMLCIHQNSVHNLYKLGPELCIGGWLFNHNHIEKKTKKYQV